MRGGFCLLIPLAVFVVFVYNVVCMKLKHKTPRWPDYELVDLKDTVTFGTSLFIRKDRRALRIVFPCGDSIQLAPVDELKDNEIEYTP